MVFICVSNALLRGEYVNFPCSIILLWSNSNILSPVRNSFLSNIPDYRADTFAASLLISFCNFSALILSSSIMIKFYIVSIWFFLKHKELSDGGVVKTTNYGFAVHFL